jgi:uncharacterized membrane protein
MSKTLVRFVETSAPRIAYVSLAVFAMATALRSHDDTTIALVGSSLAMFAACWANATQLFGVKAALRFVVIAVCLGWFAEHMGASRGWFFGSYTYTDVLGRRLGDVPLVVPLMWFALCYVGVVTASLIIWQAPTKWKLSLPTAVFMSLLAAALITSYDLGADPYMVYVVRAWIMTEKDGGWFGETLQGFLGWMTVAFAIISVFRWTTRSRPQPSHSSYRTRDALVPLSIYAGSMVFQIVEGNPIETRVVAAFAMGVPLLCAFAGLWRWHTERVEAPFDSQVSDARLSHLQFHADPLADDTVASIIGPRGITSEGEAKAHAFQQIELMNQQMARWDSNEGLLSWPAAPTGLPEGTVARVQDYLRVGHELPEWADAGKIERAEVLFWDYGALSCTLLFCASLPECYVLPHLSAVLNVAGQLEQHTNHRVRATAAMIFPVMAHGGLRDPKGRGLAQILKVRLIHATIRHLILHATPAQTLSELGDQLHVEGAGVIEPTERAVDGGLHEALYARGWSTGRMGLPCNQEELAYTLLTFSYVFLRSLRKLGIGLPPDDELAVLHTWNVVGHVLGIRRELMAHTMDQAAALFAQMQAPERLRFKGPDPRPDLGRALMNALEDSIPLRILKPFPALMTRHLCGAAQARTLGIDGRVSWLARGAFTLFFGTTRTIDGLARFVLPQFSISRMLTRVLGYHFTKRLLLDQTRPLNLPAQLLAHMNGAVAGWGRDPNAPGWLNAVEDRLTTRGAWTPSEGYSEGK